ncbi:hypothetical protein WMW72_20560 [Paenibacillus filicis]|uniref:Uncharacterized protein n=1 Tax=Paenibacillus filicis TaxID=669464 RepID=A0ABU9DN59_9BACL
MNVKKRVLPLAGMFVLGIIGGSALMYNDTVYHSIREVLDQGATQNAIGSNPGITPQSLSSMDIETAMLLVQSNRAALMDNQFNDQLNAVKLKTEELAKQNAVLAVIKAELAKISPDAKSTDKISASAELTTALSQANIVASLKVKGDLDTLHQQMLSKVDAINNALQMDMLRLQSLMTKRNEALVETTNLLEKKATRPPVVLDRMR